MTLRDSVQINRSPETVWPFVEDPERRKLWNPKIQKVDPISWGEPSVGYRYRITYLLGKNANTLLAEVTGYRKPEKLVIRHTEGRLPRNGHADEIYELTRNEAGTYLEQRIEIHNSGINIFLRLLIALVARFGKPVGGKRYLEELRDLVEGGLKDVDFGGA